MMISHIKTGKTPGQQTSDPDGSRDGSASSLKQLLGLGGERFSFVSDYDVLDSSLSSGALLGTSSSLLEATRLSTSSVCSSVIIGDDVPDCEDRCSPARLLAVSPLLPADMRRTAWTIMDYSPLEQLCAGYTSDVFLVCQATGPPLLHMP